MKAFTKLDAKLAPLPLANIDTDQIIPKQFLKTVSREGLAKGLFFDFKTRPDGTPDPDFVLNKPAYKQAAILIAKENFGCGSSREHAPWALQQYGFRAIIAPSFADIFFNNSFKNGFFPLALKDEEVDALFQESAASSDFQLTIDLPAQTVSTPAGLKFAFEIDPFRKDCLIRGLDEIGLSLQHADAIRAYESRRRETAPWLFA